MMRSTPHVTKMNLVPSVMKDNSCGAHRELYPVLNICGRLGFLAGGFLTPIRSLREFSKSFQASKASGGQQEGERSLGDWPTRESLGTTLSQVPLP